jgi:hypothetical protein
VDGGHGLIRHAFFEPRTLDEQQFDTGVAAAKTEKVHLMREGLDAATRSIFVNSLAGLPNECSFPS